jgi:hypothetical protein
MPKQDTRVRGKRSRDEVEGSSRKSDTTHNFAPVNPSQTSGSSSFGIHSRDSSGLQHQHGEVSGAIRSAEQPQLPLPQVPLGKVAIPALKQPRRTESVSPAFKRGRTAHACDNCRKSKSGCTGELPCLKCRNAGVSCVYGDGKRDKDRKYGVRGL